MKQTKTYSSHMHIHVRYHLYESKVILRNKGIIQIHHGFGEHADCYDELANYLLNQGYIVVVSDFAGHGKSLINFEQGYFGSKLGPINLVKDMHRLQNIMRRQYPDLPYFMLGVDLGSVFIRKYLEIYGDFIEGAMLLGTPPVVENRYFKKSYLKWLKTWNGPLHKATGYFRSFHQSHNKSIRKPNSEISWLTSDADERKKFLDDPMTHFSYTVQGYRDIIQVIQDVNTEESIAKIPKHIALYIGYGKLDPMSKKIEVLIRKYKKAHILDVTVEAFPDMRHAILFEKEKTKVYEHLLAWLEERTYL